MSNPFKEEDVFEPPDEKLIERAVSGDKASLEALILRHQSWVYNIALRMVWEPADAADVTQEILIKVMTKLSTFRGQSSFRTWLYRIVSNHVLNMKKHRREFQAVSFEQYGESLDRAPSLDVLDDAAVDRQVLIEEAKIGCMTGMLLCLEREQRLIYILGELFQVSDRIGAEILGLSRGNFRVKLSRAKKQLYNFMNEKCGLINKANPCRCARKTQAFMKAGYVDPKNLRFTQSHRKSIEATVGKKSKEVEEILDSGYMELYLQHLFLDPPDLMTCLKKRLSSKALRDAFNL